MLKATFDAQSDQLKKKGAAGTMELLEQIDQIQRLKNRANKERAALQKQLEMGQSNLDDEAKKVCWIVIWYPYHDKFVAINRCQSDIVK